MTRRQLLATLPAVSAAPRTLRLGAPLFLNSTDPAELAREHRRLGYSAAYAPKASLADAAHLRAIEDAFRQQDVTLAEVGVWVNLLDADSAQRKANLDKVSEGLALADAIGARCCVDIVGSYHPQFWEGPHPRNVSQECFDAAVENARRILDAVKPRRARFAYEMMGWTLPDSPDSYLALIKAIDRPAFGVHIDICNLVNSPRLMYNNKALIEETFSKLGPWIASCHAKDLDWVRELNVHFLEVIPGRGRIDYPAYLKAIASLPGGVPLMLEHLKSAADYQEGLNFIVKTLRQQGLQPA